MAADPLHAVSPDEPAANSPTAGRSAIDRIRERHERRQRVLELAIPEWDGDVVVRYGRLSPRAIIDVRKRRGPAWRANAALLVAAAREVLIRDENGALRPAREADGQTGAVRFDGRLADLFEIEADSPEDIVRRMYSDDVAIGAHAQRIYNWQTGDDMDELDAEEVEDLAGEADAAT